MIASVVRRLGILLALLAAAMIGPVGTAEAGIVVPPKPDYYSWMSCLDGTVTGSFTTISAFDEDGRVRLNFIGDVHGCQAPREYDVYGLAYYRADGAAGVWLRQYFSAESHFDSGTAIFGVPADTVGFCLIASPDQRLDCYSIEESVVGNLTLHEIGGRIPVTDPRVAVEFSVDMTVYPSGEPGCDTCWP
ncbi:MAG: hypothetical protein HOU81_05205 [Hamadaea sp.]|uniref:hypothetical protein n=1 Tax=Hamadaea sp. TaxID=2024425 RepID=UPI0017B52016|nr:hypothetical protein [Hamadaea sp.]NUR70195.1 hypothetical protein [Hamadaea sp.]NUT24138.1 hypothetical protein [Hamadaea sp.]